MLINYSHPAAPLRRVLIVRTIQWEPEQSKRPCRILRSRRGRGSIPTLRSSWAGRG